LQKAAAESSKPVVAAFVAQPELLRQPEGERLATVAYPESAAAVLAALVRRPRQELPAMTRKTVHLRAAPDLEQSFRLLKKYGIPVVRYAFARRIPKRASFPLAMKLVAADIIHKTEAGAVSLNIRNMRELRAAWPKRKVRGVLLQPMVSTRRELILGFRRDEQGTPMVIAGLGGVLAEALDAVSLRVLPVSRADALEMLDEIPGSRILDAFRGWPPMDRNRIADVILRLAQLGADHPQIAEIDINPLVEPCHALDARILLTADKHQ